MGEDTFSILHDAGNMNVPGSSLLVGIDETGHEDLSDGKFPLFGLGGCATLIKHQESQISAPWRAMKDRFFQGADSLLHAADLRNPTPEQSAAVGKFFSELHFFRFAVMARSAAINKTGLPMIKVMCGAILERIANIATWCKPQPTGVVVVFEHSERTFRQMYGSLAGYRIGPDEKTAPEIRVFFAEKAANQPFLEVADFVMHTAGCHLRNKLRGDHGTRKDFRAVFQPLDHRTRSYVELAGIQLQESKDDTPPHS